MRSVGLRTVITPAESEELMTVVDPKGGIDRVARAVAVSFGLVNCAAYVAPLVLFLVSPRTLDRLVDHSWAIAAVAYGSFLISLTTACLFTVTTKERRSLVALLYTMLAVLDLVTLLIHLGLSGLGRAQLFG